MSIAYFVLLICVSELLVMVATDQQLGFNPYPFGSTIFCWVARIFVIITSIWHLGWVLGIIISILEIFTFVHLTFGWVLSLPSYSNLTECKVSKIVKTRISLLTPAAIASAVFCITSFITVEYKSTLKFFANNMTLTIIIATLSSILFVVRIFVGKAMNDDDIEYRHKEAPKPQNNVHKRENDSSTRKDFLRLNFTSFYNAALNVINKKMVSVNSAKAATELFYFMYILTDYSAFKSGLDRSIVSQTVIGIARDMNIRITSDEANRRTALYSEFINGKKAHTLFSICDLEQPNGIVSTILAFGDILYNPNMADDYDNAPLLIMGIHEQISFTEVFLKELTPILNSYLKSIKNI